MRRLTDRLAAIVQTIEAVQETTEKIDSGEELLSQKAIADACVQARKVLLDTKEEVHACFKDILVVKKDLLDNLQDVQKANRKERLLKQQEELAEKISALN